MNNYDFSFDETNQSSDDEFCFADGSNNLAIPVDKDHVLKEHFTKSVSMTKTKNDNINKIQISSTYEIDKLLVKECLAQLDELYLIIKRKKADENEVKQSSLKNQFKKDQEIALKAIELCLFKQFSKSNHPFWLNLILIENSKDFQVKKYNSLSCLIAKAFNKWIKTNQSKFILNDELKQFAFILSTKHHLFMIDYVFDSYEMSSCEMLLPYLQYKISGLKEAKDKAVLISTLMMHDHFDFEEILLPLLLEDKVNMIEKYLEKSPKQQMNFVKYLDKMNDKNSHISSYLNRLPAKVVNLEKLSRKQLEKLAIRLMKNYKIDPIICPNVTSHKYLKNLRYLVFRRYIDKSIMYLPWHDLVTECLDKADQLSREAFIILLADNNDYREANLWIKKLNINSNNLPNYINETVKNHLKNNPNDLEDLTDNLIDLELEKKFHPLKLNNIKLVDNEKDYNEFLNEVLESNNEQIHIGIDCEWKPTCVGGVDVESNIRVALIQIATMTKIFLLDPIKLGETLKKNEFETRFLGNKRIIKIGYGFAHDLKILARSFHISDGFRQSVFDIEHCANYLAELNVPFREIKEENIYENKATGLSELVRLCFGKALNKSEQISNWEKRPLRSSQIKYAALDAYCLLEVFEHLKQQAHKVHKKIDFNQFIGKKMKRNQKSKQPEQQEVYQEKRMKEISKFQDKNFQINKNPIKPQDLHLVCDNMLGGLGKELRRCGVDTIILDNNQEHVECAKIARNESRYALSCGLPFHIIRSQLADDRCIYVSTKNAKEQCSHVLRMFNVNVGLDDLFSRCRACNTRGYTVINKIQCKALWMKQKSEMPDLFVECDKLIEKKRKNQFILEPLDHSYVLDEDSDLNNKVNYESYYLVNYPQVRVKFESIFDTTIETVDSFYICNGCGHIYWEGPHWQNIETRFSHVLARYDEFANKQ